MNIVGGGSMPKFAENTVLIWDDAKKKFIFELTFPSVILAIRLRRDKYVNQYTSWAPSQNYSGITCGEMFPQLIFQPVKYPQAV